jgi:hypothetical protein
MRISRCCHVMAITKCPILALSVNRFTAPPRVVSPVCPHQRRIVRAGLMEKIMSRTGHNTEVSELTESELEKVSGGEDKDPISAWYLALGRVGLPLPSQGGPTTDVLSCVY